MMFEIDSLLDAGGLLSGIDGVIFDLDDTLYSEKDYVRSGYKAVAALFPELFISSDVPRWVAMTLTCQFALLFAVYLNGDMTVRSVLGGSGGKTFVRKLVCLLCAAVYIAVIMYIGRALPMFR